MNLQNKSPELAEASRHWDTYYRDDRHKREWHLDQASPELLALLAAGVIKPCRALDLGCGGGTEAVHLATQGFEVTALDISNEALAMTRRLAARRGVKVATVQAFVPKTGLEDQAFEFVNDRSCFHVIEPRLDVLRAYAAEVKRLLVPGGILFVRRFGQTQVGLSDFKAVFQDDFDLGVIQEVPFHEPHMPSRVAVLRRLAAASSLEST
jgi:2-polyprenyl-3-methyl-5-hydroxy-6-metoxy-1,4-benzoquinol methylase